MKRTCQALITAAAAVLLSALAGGALAQAPADPLEEGFRHPPDSDLSGYNFWLGKLDEFGGNFVQAEMVKSFIVSGEYRDRFNSPSGF